jgi:hypothetical protein
MDDLDNNSTTYQICVLGELDESWQRLFGGVSIIYAGRGRSVLQVRVPDQSALRGILERIWDLNLVLLSVAREEPVLDLPVALKETSNLER